MLSLGLVDEIQFSISPLAWGEGERPRLAESSVKLVLLRATPLTPVTLPCLTGRSEPL